MAKGKEDKKESSVSREERLARIQHLVRERGDDAAKMVKTWLHRSEDKPK